MRPKTTILRSMGAIVVLAVALAALKYPTFWWASGLVTLQVGLFSFAVLQALMGKERSRACWAGFAIFGISYVHATYSLSRYKQVYLLPPPSLLVEILLLRDSPFGLVPGASDITDESGGSCTRMNTRSRPYDRPDVTAELTGRVADHIGLTTIEDSTRNCMIHGPPRGKGKRPWVAGAARPRGNRLWQRHSCGVAPLHHSHPSSNSSVLFLLLGPVIDQLRIPCGHTACPCRSAAVGRRGHSRSHPAR